MSQVRPVCEGCGRPAIRAVEVAGAVRDYCGALCAYVAMYLGRRPS